MPKMKIDYLEFKQLPVSKSSIVYELIYKIIESDYEGQVIDTNKPFTYKLMITLTNPKRATWLVKGLDEENVPNVCFEFGRRFLIKKIKDGNLEKDESYQINEDIEELYKKNLPILEGQIDYIITANNPLKY